MQAGEDTMDRAEVRAVWVRRLRRSAEHARRLLRDNQFALDYPREYRALERLLEHLDDALPRLL